MTKQKTLNDIPNSFWSSNDAYGVYIPVPFLLWSWYTLGQDYELLGILWIPMFVAILWAVPSLMLGIFGQSYYNDYLTKERRKIMAREKNSQRKAHLHLMYQQHNTEYGIYQRKKLINALGGSINNTIGSFKTGHNVVCDISNDKVMGYSTPLGDVINSYSKYILMKSTQYGFMYIVENRPHSRGDGSYDLLSSGISYDRDKNDLLLAISKYDIKFCSDISVTVNDVVGIHDVEIPRNTNEVTYTRIMGIAGGKTLHEAATVETIDDCGGKPVHKATTVENVDDFIVRASEDYRTDIEADWVRNVRNALME